MFIYCLKMIACSTVLYALYALVFQKEKMLVFNRFYLLTALVISFLIPLITITIRVPADAATDNLQLMTSEPVPYSPATEVSSSFQSVMSWQNTLTGILIAVSLFILVRLVINLLRIRNISRNHSTIQYKNASIVLLKESVEPYSFMGTVFLNKSEFENGKIEEEVLEHELAHVNQKHSWDILFVELMQVVSWFNPILYLYKRSIKINHELLADAAAIKYHDDVRNYQRILLLRATRLSSIGLVSSFNFLTIKKRMIMLQKKQNIKRSFIKSLLTLPVLAMLIFIFHQTIYAEETGESVVRSESLFTLKDTGVLARYETLLDKYGLKGFNSPKDFIEKRQRVTEIDFKNMAELFFQLSFDEKNVNAVRFEKILPPFKKVKVTDSDLQKWVDGKMYGVWIDGKRFVNERLKEFNGNDFSHVFVSKLSPNAKNYGKHYYQIDLMTNKYYDSYYSKTMNDIKQLKYIMVVVRGLGDTKDSSHTGISDIQILEYQKLSKQFIIYSEGKPYLKNTIPEEIYTELRLLYVKMNLQQKKGVQPPPPLQPSLVSDNVDTLPPPPPPFSKESQLMMNECPVIYECWNNGDKVAYVTQIKEQKLPANAKNMLLKAVDNKLMWAIVLYEGFKSKVVDISTVQKQKDFEKAYGIVLAPIPPVPAAPPDPPAVPDAPPAPPSPPHVKR